MDAEGASLADEAIEQQRGFLSDLVVFDEELLKLVHDQHDARQRRRAGRVAVAVEVLHARVAEPIGAGPHLVVELLKHAHAELAFALDRDHARMRQFLCGIDLEFHTLLEVNQIQIDLIGAIIQREVGNQGVQQG